MGDFDQQGITCFARVVIESPTGDSESESPKNGTRVGLESEYYNSEIKTLNNKMPLGTLNTK